MLLSQVRMQNLCIQMRVVDMETSYMALMPLWIEKVLSRGLGSN